jgi:hypothetical protein
MYNDEKYDSEMVINGQRGARVAQESPPPANQQSEVDENYSEYIGEGKFQPLNHQDQIDYDRVLKGDPVKVDPKIVESKFSSFFEPKHNTNTINDRSRWHKIKKHASKKWVGLRYNISILSPKTKALIIGVVFFLSILLISVLLATLISDSDGGDHPPKTCAGKLEEFKHVQTLDYLGAGARFGTSLYAPSNTRYLVSSNSPGEFVAFRYVDGLYDMVNVEKLTVPVSHNLVLSERAAVSPSGMFKVFTASHLNAIEAIVFKSNTATDKIIFGRHLNSVQYQPAISHASNLIPGKVKFDPSYPNVFYVMSIPGTDTICQIGEPYRGEMLVFQIDDKNKSVELIFKFSPYDDQTSFTGNFEINKTGLFITVTGGVEHHDRTSNGHFRRYRSTISPSLVVDTTLFDPSEGFGVALSIMKDLLFITTLSDTATLKKPGVLLQFKLSSANGRYEYVSNTRLSQDQGYFSVHQSVFNDQYLLASSNSGTWGAYKLDAKGNLALISVVQAPVDADATSFPDTMVVSNSNVPNSYFRMISARHKTPSSIRFYTTECKIE